MKKQIRRILSVVLCALVLFSGILNVNYDEHIHLGEDHLHTQDVQDDHAHEEVGQGVLSVLENVVEFLLFGIAVPVSADYSDGVNCDYCGAWRFDDWKCDNGDHCGEGADGDCYEEHHCGYL